MDDRTKLKQCKPVTEKGCGQVKPLSEFPKLRKRMRSHGYVYTQPNWCSECERKKENIRRGRVPRKKLPKYRYAWDNQKKGYRCYKDNITMCITKSESQAAIWVRMMSGTDDIWSVFTRLPPPAYRWDHRLQALVAR